MGIFRKDSGCKLFCASCLNDSLGFIQSDAGLRDKFVDGAGEICAAYSAGSCFFAFSVI